MLSILEYLLKFVPSVGLWILVIFGKEVRLKEFRLRFIVFGLFFKIFEYVFRIRAK